MGRQTGEVVTVAQQAAQRPESQDTVCPIPDVAEASTKGQYGPSALALPDSLGRLCNSPWQHSTILLNRQVVRSPIPRLHYPLRQGSQATGFTALGGLFILFTLAVVVRRWFW